MPRKPRLHVPGGLYHVILRGNRREAIFFDEDDRDLWETLLAEGLERYQHSVHVYCWMPNHIHMALRCGCKPLAGLMRWVASQYARSINRKKSRSGHLFERRYRAMLVQTDSYLLELVRYIHRNPLRAEIVNDLREYTWSSHAAYLGLVRRQWLTTEWVLSHLGSTEDQARKVYRKLMEVGQPKQLDKLLEAGSAKDDRVLGDERFAESIENRIAVPPQSVNLDDEIERVCSKYGVNEAELAAPSRNHRLSRIRAEIAIYATDTSAASLADVARRFNRSQAVLSRTMSRIRYGRKS